MANFKTLVKYVDGVQVNAFETLSTTFYLLSTYHPLLIPSRIFLIFDEDNKGKRRDMDY